MLTIPFETAFGIIPVRGPAEAFGRSRPVVLAITGMAADPDDMTRLPQVLGPGFDGMVAALPGNRTPELSITSIEAFGQAFDEIVVRLNRPVVVLGLFEGGLAALAMRRPGAMVVVDPPLSTGRAWPYHPRLAAGLETHGEFLDKVLGYTAAGIQDRRYHHLLNGLAAPVEVIVGEEPLFPMRPLKRLPSLLDEPDRALMAAHPLITLSVAPGAGHDIPRQAAAFLLQRLHAVCESLARPIAPMG